ncbi:hypothetical protein [uncultured Roseibium sp.]|uniref:hypothetical protein n=1 Tax=uncultured Roseibium sp. TaxID=1936171 RepID=UPI002639E9E0|nr:hypothetical protein [uncultured Roseibium sp.]
MTHSRKKPTDRLQTKLTLAGSMHEDLEVSAERIQSLNYAMTSFIHGLTLHPDEDREIYRMFDHLKSLAELQDEQTQQLRDDLEALGGALAKD